MKIFEDILGKYLIKSIIFQNGKVYFVGGCVRDFILGKEPKDIDIVVSNLHYSNLVSILEKYGKVDTVGESFGVIKFKEFNTNFELDIALPRIDSKDEKVKGHKSIVAQSNPFMSIENDLERRDFTINSIAIDSNLNYIDPFNGLKHLEQKLIIATNNETFKDDPLRMLRAIQFASRFNFELSSHTVSLITENVNKINEITSERILMEFQKVFDKKGNLQKFLSLLIATGLFKQIFGYSLTHSKEINFFEIKSLSEFLFYCCYKQFKNVNDLIKHLQDKLKIDNETVRQIKALYYFITTPIKLGGFNRHCFDTLQVYEKSYEFGILKEEFSNFLSKKYPKSFKELPLNGEDIMKILELQPGPDIKKVQSALTDYILQSGVPNSMPFMIDYIKEYKKNYL